MKAVETVSTATIGIWLWAHGQVGAGVVATALPLAWQVANVSGWVSWEVTGIFESIGVVQEGMQTIAVPHAGGDRPGARELAVPRGDEVVPLTHEQLATLLGVGRSYTSRTIQSFKAEGILETRRGSILVRNPDALRGRSCLCNEAVKAHFEEVLRGVYPDPEKGN